MVLRTGQGQRSAEEETSRRPAQLLREVLPAEAGELTSSVPAPQGVFLNGQDPLPVALRCHVSRHLFLQGLCLPPQHARFAAVHFQTFVRLSDRQHNPERRRVYRWRLSLQGRSSLFSHQDGACLVHTSVIGPDEWSLQSGILAVSQLCKHSDQLILKASAASD